jgi:putative ABC transport system permease protein
MPGGARFVERMADILLRLTSPHLSRSQRDELTATIAAVCADVRARHGIGRGCATAAAELLNLVALPIRRRFGIDAQVTESWRAPTDRRRGGCAMLLDDCGRALRRLRTGTSVLALAVGMLGLAIGVTAAMFTVLDALVLHPVPFKHADRLVRVVEGVNNGRGMLTRTSPDVIRSWTETGAFADVQAAISTDVVIDAGAEPIARRAARITPGMLAMLGVRPLLGRDFNGGEGRTGTDDRILLSEELWTALFNRAPSIIGRRIRISGASTEVVGILPSGFRFPTATTIAWQPIDLNAPPAAFAEQGALAFARLRDGVPDADILRVADRALANGAEGPPDRRTMLRPVAAGMVDKYSRQAVTSLSIGVALVFLVLCANAMNLMLTRFSARQREFGLCSALGASRARLLREALAETALIGLAALAVGLLIANGLVSASAQLLPESLVSSTLTPVAVSSRAVAVTSILGFIAAAVAGITPAWMATRTDATHAVRPALHGASASRAARRLARGLLVAEVALATTLLASAALLIRTFVNLAAAERGLDADGVITGWVSMPAFDFADPPGRRAFASAMEDRLRALPAVRQVSLSNGVPPGAAFTFFGKIRPTVGAETSLAELKIYSVTPTFFELFRIPLLAGRSFSAAASAREAVIGERLAAMLWPQGNAVGQSFTMGSGRTAVTVVGVAREIRNPSADPRLDPPELYFPLLVDQNGRVEAAALANGQIFIAIRCQTSCPALSEIRDAIHAAGPRAVITSLGPLEQDYARVLARPRAAALLAATFGLIALAAATAGTFGVLAAGVARRRREFGIRVALGMAPGGLRRLVLLDAALLAAIGLGLGTLGAWSLGRALSSLTFDVSPADPASWAAVAATLALSTVAAASLPAAQAARADPTLLLREE